MRFHSQAVKLDCGESLTESMRHFYKSLQSYQNYFLNSHPAESNGAEAAAVEEVD